MKQTAVEWLVEQLNLHEYEDVIKQANKMFEEQVMGAFNDGVNDECIGGNKTPEQYYKETFKSE
jgi:hypothetical protein